MATAERPWALGIVLAAYAVMWVGGVATLWRGTAAPSWAAPLFLLLAAAAAALAGGRGAWLAVALFGAGGFLAELVGVHAGFPFGAYRYTAALAPSLESVPLAIACAWIVLLSFARDLAWRWTRRPAVAVLAGAAVMTAFDLLLDPVAAGPLGYWRWLHGGPWFGVPLLNFAGWFVVSAVLLAAAGKPRGTSGVTAAVGWSVAAFFAIAALRAAVSR